MKEAINSNSVVFLKKIISSEVKIIDMWVENKWLVAKLSSNIYFKVKNHT